MKTLALSLLFVLPLNGEGYREFVNPGTRDDYRGDREVLSRRSDHFLFRFGPENKQGILTEQLFQSHLQFLEHVYGNWTELGLHPLGGSDPDVKYKSVIEPGQSWKGDLAGTAVGFGVGNEVPGLHIPANALLASAPNGCTPHELGHGWQNQGRAFGGGLPPIASPGYTEALANWVMQLHLVDYPDDWPAVGFTYGHACMSYNCMSLFNAFLEEPGYGAGFINQLVYGKNINSFADMGADDIIRKAIRHEPTGARDKAGAIHDVLGRMNAKMLGMDFWNHREGIHYGVQVDRDFAGFFFNRIKMVKQPGVEDGWLRPEWTCVPQYLMNSYIPLEPSGRVIECDFRPVADPVRKTAFRAGFVAFDAQGRPRYGKLWNAGRMRFELADDDAAVYLAIIACPEKSNTSLVHNDYTSEHPAIFPYRIRLSGAEPREWEWERPGAGCHRHPNGGGLVANSAHVDGSAFVAENAMVLGKARVFGNSRIEDFALITDEAKIGREGQVDAPVISGHAVVLGEAKVHGRAKVRGHAWLWGESEVSERAVVMAHTMLNGARVSGDAVMNQAPLRDRGLAFTGTFGGSAIIGGDLSGGGEFMREVACEFPRKVDDCRHQYIGYTFEKDSCVFALDEFGMNHSYLVNQPVPVTAKIGETETTALKLNGRDQYIELRPDAVDFADLTIALWVRNEGSNSDATVFSLGDGGKKVMRFGTDGRLLATDGSRRGEVALGSPLPRDEWVHVALTFDGDTVSLFRNGRKVAANERFTIDPDDLHAPLMHNANYIGRGNRGGHFTGLIDEFRIIRKALTAPEITELMRNIEGGKAPSFESEPPAPIAWLAPPEQSGNGQAHAITTSMSAQPGEDPNGVLYYFRCLDDSSLDSGWISENNYICAGMGKDFTVHLKDRFGNESAESEVATTLICGSDIEPPKMEVQVRGLDEGSIRVSAPELPGAGGLVRYRFTGNGSEVGSGWNARPDWVDKTMPEGASCTYQVEIRDGRGEVHSAASEPATARDDTPPAFSEDARWQWRVYPYVQLDRTVRLAARELNEEGVEYYFECVGKPETNSGWTSAAEWTTTPMPYGEHHFRFKVRDASPQRNESAWSHPRKAAVARTNTFGDYRFGELAGLPDDTLVRFEGRVTKVEARHYVVSARDSNESIIVIPRTFGADTVPAMLNRQVRVQGHLWRFEELGRVVDYAIVARDPQAGRIEFEDCRFPDEKIFPEYSPTASKRECLGWHRPGWFVEVENVAACKELQLGYAIGGPLEIHVNGALQKMIDLPHTAGREDFKVAKLDGLDIPEGATLRFTGNSGTRFDFLGIGLSYHEVAGRVVAEDGKPLANALVSFSRKSPVREFVEVVARSDKEGRFHERLESGDWFVTAASEGIGYRPSPERRLAITDDSEGSLDFRLKASDVRVDFPREDKLMFACLADLLLVWNKIPSWQAYRPEGLVLKGMSELGPRHASSDGYHWFDNDFDASGGFAMEPFRNDIPIDGATIIARVHHRRNDDGGNWRSIVDVFYDRLVMGVQNSDGRIIVRRNGTLKTYDEILPEKPVVMSLVVQRTGHYKLYLDGTELISEEGESDMTRFEVNSDDRPFANRISVGRGFDGWATFNGKVGDVCLYKVALSDRERRQVEVQFMRTRE